MRPPPEGRSRGATKPSSSAQHDKKITYYIRQPPCLDAHAQLRYEVRRITVSGRRIRYGDASVRAARQGIVGARGLDPSGGYGSRYVVESLGRSARVPARLSPTLLLRSSCEERADRVHRYCRADAGHPAQRGNLVGGSGDRLDLIGQQHPSGARYPSSRPRLARAISAIQRLPTFRLGSATGLRAGPGAWTWVTRPSARC